jgi:hypothetical protein
VKIVSLVLRIRDTFSEQRLQITSEVEENEQRKRWMSTTWEFSFCPCSNISCCTEEMKQTSIIIHHPQKQMDPAQEVRRVEGEGGRTKILK